jgi:hypothetical protein
MQGERKKILLYDLTNEQEAFLTKNYGTRYKIVKTDCFTDILAIPAMMVVVNPEKLTWSDINQMNEVFKYDFDTLIIFTKELDDETLNKLCSIEIIDGHLSTMMHYISTDLNKVDRSAYGHMVDTYISDFIKSIEAYPVDLNETKTLLKNIEENIMPTNHMLLTDKAGWMRGRSSSYKYLYEVIKHVDESEEIRNIPFRYEILDTLLALKLAYGMIDENSPLLAAEHSFCDVDKEWILYLAEQFKTRKSNKRHHIQHHCVKESV